MFLLNQLNALEFVEFVIFFFLFILEFCMITLSRKVTISFNFVNWLSNLPSSIYRVFLKSCPLFQGLYKSHFNSCWSKIRQKESIRVKLFGFRRIFEYIAVYESCQGSKSVYFLPLALFYSSFCQYSIFKKFTVKSTNFSKKLMKIW